MAAVLICHTLIQNAEIAPDALDIRNQCTARSEHTLIFEQLPVLLEPLLRNTVGDVNRRNLGRPQGLAELIRGTMVGNKLFDDIAILFLQIRDTRDGDGIRWRVTFCSANAVVHRRIQF